MNDKIPKIVHMTWKDKNVFNHSSALIQNGLRNLIELNSNWKVVIHDDNDIDSYLRIVLSPEHYSLIENVHVVEKSDLWRLFKLYTEGGLYVDLDRFCNVKLDDLLDEDTMCVLPTYLDVDFSQDFMMSAPQNPIYLKTIEMILTRRKMGIKETYVLGPQTYMHSVTSVLCGVEINSNPGLEIFSKIRSTIESYPFIKTYREIPPYDTILYKHNELTFRKDDSKITDWQKLKEMFYHSYGLRHWSNEW